MSIADKTSYANPSTILLVHKLKFISRVDCEGIVGYIRNLISVLIFAVALFVSDANAGVLFNDYIKAEQSLIEAQRKSPDHIIRFADPAGNLAFSVLNYDKFQSVLTEIESDVNKSNKLRDMYVLTELILRSYTPTFIDASSQRFAKNGTQYILEKEYLCNTKIFLLIIYEMSKDADYRPVSDTLQQSLRQFSSIVSGQIRKDIFSKNGAAEANRILATFEKP